MISNKRPIPIVVVFIFLISSVFTGCVTPTESLLQQIDVNGVPIRHPIRITENREPGNVNIRANLSFNNKNNLTTQSDKHTKVNEQGVFQVDEVAGEDYFLEQNNVNRFNFDGNNVSWNIPIFKPGLS